MLIVGHEDLRNQYLESGLEHQEMHVRRPEGVAALSIQQLPDYVAVGWNRVAGGFDAPEAERPSLVGGELAAQVHVRLFGILALVESGCRRMPHIHFGADDGLIRPIADVPDEEKRRA